MAWSEPNPHKRPRPASAVMAQPQVTDTSNPYLGWIAGAIVIALVLVTAAALWVHFHG